MDQRMRRDALFFLEYLGLLLVALLWVQLEDVRLRVGANIGLFYGLDLATIGYLAIRAYLVLKRKVPPFWDTVWLGIDLLVISLFVRITGGITSEAALTYLWPLLTSSVTRAPVRTLLIGACIGALYVVVTWPSVISTAYLISLAARLLILALMTLLAYAFARTEAARIEEVARLREQAVLSDFRTRLSFELHDTTQQYLDTFSEQIGEVRELLRKDPRAAAEALEQMQDTVSRAVTDLRQTAQRIRTPPPGP